MQVSPVISVSPAVASSSALPPGPQSGTIGSYGSFWLPGDAETLRGRTVPDRQGQSQKGRGQGGGQSGRSATDVRQAMRGGQPATSSLTDSKTSASKASTTQGKAQTGAKPAGSKTASYINNGRSISGKALINDGRGGPRSAENSAVSTPIKSRAQGREPLLSTKPDRFFHPDDQGDANNRRRHGAKHAREAGESVDHLRKSKTEVKERIEFEAMTVGKTTAKSGPLLVGSETGRMAAPETLRAILPVLTARVALLSRESRRVARFAIDLPGGAKLGVRIELSGKKVRLAFVTSDPELHSVLCSGKGLVGETLKEFGFDCGDLHVASSYRELDQSLPRAA